VFAEKIEIILKITKTDIVFLRIAVSAKGELKSALRCEFQIPYYILAKHTRYKTEANKESSRISIQNLTRAVT
jgi:hypothetical protein